jgi:hypothetical protein
MLRSTSDNQHPHKSALGREMQLAIGQQLSVECELPQDLPTRTSSIGHFERSPGNGNW